ncbi:MAG: hypothetical protein QME41_05810 [Actinomycetota bacterium]|nr:hypothetical protein [Actinomycetota bacterium]
MDYSKTARKLRARIGIFSGELSNGLPLAELPQLVDKRCPKQGVIQQG